MNPNVLVSLLQFHIVNLKSSHNGNVTAVLGDPTGAAALGFFIEVRNDSFTRQMFHKNPNACDATSTW